LGLVVEVIEHSVEDRAPAGDVTDRGALAAVDCCVVMELSAG